MPFTSSVQAIRVSLHECKKKCLAERRCIAVEINGLFNNKYYCNLNMGKTNNFALGCNVNLPVEEALRPMCYRRSISSKQLQSTSIECPIL